MKFQGKRKVEIKKYDTEQRKPDKDDQLSVYEKSEKKLQEEELMKQVPKGKNQCTNSRTG